MALPVTPQSTAVQQALKVAPNYADLFSPYRRRGAVDPQVQKAHSQNALTRALGGASVGQLAGSGLSKGLSSMVGASVFGPAGWVGAGLMGAYGALNKGRGASATAPTDFAHQDARAIIDRAYQQYLGRPMEAGAFEGGIRGIAPKGYRNKWLGEKEVKYWVDQIANSPEAQAFRTSGGASGGASGAAAGPAGGVTPNAKGWGWSPEGQKREFDYAKQADWTPGAYMAGMGGFMHDRMNNPEDTALKYIAAREMSHIDPTSEGAQQALIDRLKALGIEAQLTGAGSGEFYFPQTGERIDAMRGAPSGGFDSWQWMDLNDLAKEQAQAAQAAPSTNPATDPGSFLGNTTIDTNAALANLMNYLALNQALTGAPMNPRF